MRTSQQILDDTLRFYRVALVRQGVPPDAARGAVAPGGDTELRFRAIVQEVVHAQAYEQGLEDATLEDTAQGDQLLRLAARRGVAPSPGAGAAGEVLVPCVGTVTIPAGSELTSEDTQLRYKTTSAATITSGSAVPVIGVDVGKASDLPAGAKLRWSVPRANVALLADVGPGGLTGGLDAEDVEAVRAKVLDRLRAPRVAGNHAQIRDWLREASLAVEQAHVYPALQGPCTTHAAVTVAATAANGWSRVADSALLQSVAAYVVAKVPESTIRLTLTGVAHQALDVAIALKLPDPLQDGAASGGWLDSTTARWPTSPRTVVSVASPTRVRVTGTGVLVGAQIAIWCSGSLTWASSSVLAATVASGNTDIDLTVPVAGVSPGDYVSPAAARMGEYSLAYLAQVARLAPGEKTASAAVLERAKRRSALGQTSAVTTAPLAALQTAYPEVESAAYLLLQGVSPALPLSPPVPTSAALAPRVWRLRHFALYPE